MSTHFDPLLELRQVRVLGPQGLELGPLNGVLLRGMRLWVTLENPAHWAPLELLLTGQVQPTQGELVEPRPVLAGSDALLLEKRGLNQSIGAWLHSDAVPRYVWLEQRRRSVGVLVDWLEISAANTRRAIKLESPVVQQRFWALQFLLSPAQVLLGQALFSVEDAAVRQALRGRWLDLPGAVLAACSQAQLPGPVTHRLHLDAHGQGTVEALG